MERIITIIGLAIILGACENRATKPDKTPIENLGRPVDWQASVSLDIRTDSAAHWPRWDVSQKEMAVKDSAHSFEELLSQLWKLAFSGDTDVYGVDDLGGMAHSNKLNPTKLVYLLNSSDTVWTEDLETREITEKVVNFNFSETDASAMVLNGNLSDGNGTDLVFRTNNVGVGERVFDSEGAYRGVKVKYYIGMQSPDFGPEAVSIRLGIETDSTGIFKIQNFVGVDDSDVNLMEILSGNKGVDELKNIDIDLNLDYRNRQLFAIFRRPDINAFYHSNSI